MATVEWNDNLSIGIRLIDEQHKMMIKHLDDFATAVASRQGPNAISGTLDFLIDYTNFHFDEEEKHMLWAKFPGLGRQKTEHEAFRQTLTNLETDFKEGGATYELAGDIDTLLVNWLFTHIRAADLEFGQFLRENGITISDEG